MDKEAIIACKEGQYSVYCYEDDELVVSINLKDKSLYSAQDTANKWESGTLKKCQAHSTTQFFE